MDNNTHILATQADLSGETKIALDDYERLSAERAQEIEGQVKDDKLPNGFFFENGNLMYQPEPKGEQDFPSPIFICSRLNVTACTRDDANQNHGRLLEFKDIDNILHEWAMPMELLTSGGEEYRRMLLSMGLDIAPGPQARNLLTIYIQLSKPRTRARCVAYTGWHHKCFALPDQTIGECGKERVIMQAASSHFPDYAVAGTLHDWRQNVSILCMGNSRLVFGVSVAFASPLLSLLGFENGGFHFRGASSTGKTTALYVAASVWGGKDYIQRWRATTNGVEAMAGSHNDTLLCLDELSQVSSDEAGEIAYMLANGSGKARADRYGHSRKKASWKLLFLSTGEISLADHMIEAGKKARAGQEVRIVDIPADTGKHGLFEELHGNSNGATFSQALMQACSAFHGIPAREFLKHLMEDRQSSILLVEKFIDEFITTILPSGADGQVHRVGKRFGMVAAAGELATQFGITGWNPGDALEAAKTCFNDWVQGRGGMGSQEEQVILAQVRRFFELHGESRFTPWDASEDYRTINRAGFRRIGRDEKVNFFVLPQTFRAELAVGFHHKRVCEICLKYGLLIPGSKGEYDRSEKLPHMGSQRCYRFSAKVLGDGDETNDES